MRYSSAKHNPTGPQPGQPGNCPRQIFQNHFDSVKIFYCNSYVTKQGTIIWIPSKNINRLQTWDQTLMSNSYYRFFRGDLKQTY